MRIVVATEARFHQGSDGDALTPDAASSYPTWAGYLTGFDQVLVAARVAPAGSGGLAVEGDGVTVLPVPSYQGLGPHVRRRLALRAAVRRIVSTQESSPDPTAYLARVPGLIGHALTTELRQRGIPYGLEVVGDAADVLAGHRLASAAAGRLLARQCREAAVISYVTREVLQRRYPARPGVPTVTCPGVRLYDDDFVAAARPAPPGWSRGGARLAQPRESARPARLVTIGTQERMYKGHDQLIDAVALLRDEGCAVHVTIVGSGRHHDDIVRHAHRRGLAETVSFVRRLATRTEVRAVLDNADVFVLPSRTEGLPRVLLEAAARALPAVASAVGGIVEVLPAEDLVPPNDPRRLADSLADLLSSPQRYTEASARNLATARTYTFDRIQPASQTFLTTLREVSAGHQPEHQAEHQP